MEACVFEEGVLVGGEERETDVLLVPIDNLIWKQVREQFLVDDLKRSGERARLKEKSTHIYSSNGISS